MFWVFWTILCEILGFTISRVTDFLTKYQEIQNSTESFDLKGVEMFTQIDEHEFTCAKV